MSSKCVRTVFNEADGTLVGPLRSPRQRLPNRSMTIAFRPMTIQPRKIKTQGHFVVHEAHEEQSFCTRLSSSRRPDEPRFRIRSRAPIA
jgi:hypothetical protein